MEKKILENNIITKWYKTIESTDSKINMLGPQTKFKLNSIWDINVNAKNIGAATVVGLGIINNSLVSSLNRSATICNAPFLPSKVGPIRLWEKANNFRSTNIVNKAKTIAITDNIKFNSWIVFLTNLN